MSRSIALFCIMFTIISVNATNYNALQNQNPNVKVVFETFNGICGVINIILPGFLFLDNAFLMSGLQFALRGSINNLDAWMHKCLKDENIIRQSCNSTGVNILVSIPITIANSVLVHQAWVKMAELTPEVTGKFFGEMGEALMQEISWAPNPLQTGLIIGIPAIMEIVRYKRRERAEIERYGVVESNWNGFFQLVTCCTQLARVPSTLFIPAYLPYALFSKLLALNFFALDHEASWMLFAANIYSIVHFEEATLNWNQMAISIGLFFGGLFSACIILRLMYTGLKSLGRD